MWVCVCTQMLSDVVHMYAYIHILYSDSSSWHKRDLEMVFGGGMIRSFTTKIKHIKEFSTGIC